MKLIIFNLLLLIVISAGCQNKISNSFSILNFTVLDVNQEQEYFNCFENNHSLSMWFSHKCYNKLNDTLFFVSLSEKFDTLYIYNFKSFQTQKIILNDIPKYTINFIYYHNSDSIFIFYDRKYIYNNTDNKFDFILIDKNGNIINKYSLNNVPYIYKGSYNYTIEPAFDRIEENRIINGSLILNFSIYSPDIESPDFINFYPKQLCFYNLSTQTLKMLNVKFPKNDIGKRYNRDGLVSSYSLSYDKNKNIIINFSFSPFLYRYDFKKDTLVQIDCKYDNTFMNIDSSKWKKSFEYMSVMFGKPIWSSKYSLYFRSIYILSYKNYQQDWILQVMDSNFNHIAYLLNNEEYKTPFYENNKLLAYNKFNKLPYTIQLDNKIRKIRWNDFELNHLTEKQFDKGKPIGFEEYLTTLQVPKNSLVVIINLNYPCGHCLEYLFTKMKENQVEYEKANIYYVIYDNNTNDFSKILIKRYDLVNSKNIKMDSTLLERVQFFEQPVMDYKYRIIDYQSENKVIKVKTCTFDELTSFFEKVVNKKINNEKL